METLILDSEQFNQLLEALMYLGCCVCFCLGFNANEGSAK